MLLARRNLFRDRTRFLLSVAGVAVSIGLILLLWGYRSGIYRQASAYLENTPGSVVVAQRGIRESVGTVSVLPARTEAAVRHTPGVARVIPLISQFVVFERHDRKEGLLLIGYDPALGGGPWALVDGREPVGIEELVLDRMVARQHGIEPGDRVRLLDMEATVVGLSDGTASWAGSIAFVRLDALEGLLRAPGLRSLLMVVPEPGVSPVTLRERLDVLGTEVILKADMMANDRKLLARVYDAPIGLMVAIAFVVGVLVVGIVIYAATLERRREYGVLKAVGARDLILYRVVLAQACMAAMAGSVAGITLALAGSALLMAWRPQFRVELEPSVMGLVLVASLVMALLAALIPAREVARLEPAQVFRG